MRDYEQEYQARVGFIQAMLEQSKASGIVYGNSGGKDSALVSILCKAACPNTLGLIMPCASKRNFEADMQDAIELAERYGIENRVIDLTDQRELAAANLAGVTTLTQSALVNIAPRLRMITLYAVAASENRLVAGTGNRSEMYMGYFTKYGDGGHDFNPIADLTVTEIYEFLAHLNAPMAVRTKAPSGGLFDGQTDEAEMGITYEEIDTFLLEGKATPENAERIRSFHQRAEHKLKMPAVYQK